MSGHISFGKASIVATAVTHAKWKDDSDPPILEVFTCGGPSVSLDATDDDAEKAAHAVGLSAFYDAWAEPIKAAAKAREDAEKAAAKAAEKASHSTHAAHAR